jgi:hypothetical protein
MSNWAFQYRTEINIEDLRKSLVDVISQCLESRTPVSKAEFYKRIPLLLYGAYPPKGGKDINASLDALHWKYSELTGKYCGCQFWSDSAKRLFDRKLLEHVNGRPTASTDARHVADFLSKKIHNEYQLVHEHVFPRAELRRKLLLDREIPLDSRYLAETIERLAVGCVVLKSEHDLVNGTKGDSINPWRRYKGKIRLFENQNWPTSHLDLIKDAELL